MAQTYFDDSDACQIYELRHRACETRQQGKPLTIFFSTLQAIQLELDFLPPCHMEYVKDTTKLKKKMENERVYNFLAGLDEF